MHPRVSPLGHVNCTGLRPPTLPFLRAGLKLHNRLVTHTQSTAVPKTVGGGDEGSGVNKPPGGGGGGGGSDYGRGKENPEEGSQGPILLQGWYDRVAADPNFAMKVLVEQFIGVGAAALGDMAGRPNWGLSELDFVFSTLVVGSILNFTLMYLLAPTPVSALGPGKQSIVQKLFSENTLRSMGAPGGHFFEKGFTLPQRMVNLGYKGFVFALVGLGAGLVGTGMSNGLLAIRKKMDPNFKLQNDVPNVLFNSLTWAAHMGISSNIRYQALYGMDIVLAPLMHPKVFLMYSAGVRTVNNILGGMSFVFLAKLVGVQKAKDSQ